MDSNDTAGLLPYYKAELAYLREMGAQFARRYPKVAGRLDLAAESPPDPQVGRLIESVAFLTGRLQRQIDSEFPEITSALLSTLYPHYVNPIPSIAIAGFRVDPEQGQLTSGYTVEKNAPLFAQSPSGPAARFRTSYPVTLWPLEVVEAGFESTEQFRFLDNVASVSTVLRIKLESRGVALPELELDRLRFYLNADQETASTLYELLFCHVEQVMLLPHKDAAPIPLPADSLQPVGFGRDEDVLPYRSYSHRAHRLLQEYFAFPQKFLFVDLANLDRRGSASTLDILILLRQSETVNLNRHTFALGCTPIVNLFPKTTEPLRLDQRRTEYRLVPDLRRERTTEIHSILSVSASSNIHDETEKIEPFYSFSHGMAKEAQRSFWQAQRRPSTLPYVPGTDMWLSFLDLNFKPSEPPLKTVYAHVLCTNRGLADQLPSGARLQIEEAAPLLEIRCLTKPTPQITPPIGGATLWRLVSQLSLNHLSLTEGGESLRALREILQLSCSGERPADERQIHGIRKMECRPTVQRVGREAWRGFCQGTEINLVLDRDLYVGSGSFLFASVLNQFFGLYTSVNSFTKLVIRDEQREGIWKAWPPMAGEKAVL